MGLTLAKDNDQIIVEVVYPLPNEQTVIEVRLPTGATVMDALRDSGLLARRFDDETLQIVPDVTPVGIYGERVPYDVVLEHGERGEGYRPLAIDPKEARRARAQAPIQIL
jgi:putative ubiquitin-RnfH superfamily antitoxin RatB of RatAB toxin-antitoxin module